MSLPQETVECFSNSWPNKSWPKQFLSHFMSVFSSVVSLLSRHSPLFPYRLSIGYTAKLSYFSVFLRCVPEPRVQVSLLILYGLVNQIMQIHRSERDEFWTDSVEHLNKERRNKYHERKTYARIWSTSQVRSQKMKKIEGEREKKNKISKILFHWHWQNIVINKPYLYTIAIVIKQITFPSLNL